MGTRWHCHPPSPGACTSLWPPGHFWLHSLLVPQLQGSPGSVHVTRTPVSSLGVPPVPAWRGASGQGHVPAAASGDQGWMQALEQLPGKVPCASSWARPAHEPWAFLPGGQHRSAWGWAGPSVSLTARAPWLRQELLDLVAAGKRLLGGMCCERLGAVLWGPRAQGQVVEEVSEGGPRVPASSDPTYPCQRTWENPAGWPWRGPCCLGASGGLGGTQSCIGPFGPQDPMLGTHVGPGQA